MKQILLMLLLGTSLALAQDVKEFFDAPEYPVHEKKVPGESRVIDIDTIDLGIILMSIAEYFADDEQPKPLKLVEVNEGGHYFYFSAPSLQDWLQTLRDQNKPLINPLTREPIIKNNIKAYKLDSIDSDLVNLTVTDALPILGTQRHLDYSNDRFNEQELAQQSDEYLAEVVELNLDSNFLTHFPAILQRMPNLQELSLENNQIKSFEGMPFLTNLRQLSLDKNQIGSFEGMPTLTNLWELALDKNQIDSFKDMPFLTNLEYLWLDDNHIKSFEGMPTLTNLQLLSLDKNQIDSFKHMPALTNLQELWLHDNNIKSFEGMPVLTNLEYLWLDDNNIKSFEGMPVLTNLRELWLSDNNIKSFEGMPVLTNLRELWLSENKIHSAAINTWKEEHPNVLVLYSNQ